jgi:hypothetical protein
VASGLGSPPGGRPGSAEGSPPEGPGQLGKLHQIQIRFEPEQDRLLLRVNTQTGAELRYWLTRRIVKRLLPVLARTLESADEKVVSQPTPEARKAVSEFRREEALSQSDFSKPFQEQPTHTPLGEEPILVSKVSIRRTEQGLLLRLFPKDGQALNLMLQERVMHTLCELIRRGVRLADWDLELAPAPESTPPADKSLAH